MKGSCLCGEVSYEIRGNGVGINYCHCRSCRKASGSSFATNMAVATAEFVILDGEQSIACFQSSPGKKRYFCGICGSPLYSQHQVNEETVYVRIGTLDDDPGIRPSIHIHVASRAPWIEILDGLPTRQEQEDLDF